MENIKCFKTEFSSFHVGYIQVVPIHENFYLNSTEGSFNVIGARLLNLSYAQYLRMCRDMLGATIFGKDSLYPIPLFKDIKMAHALSSLLNARANIILFERNNPNWRKHQELIERVKRGEISPDDIIRKNS